MRTLLLAEHDNQSLNAATSKALTAALEMGGSVDLLIAGHNASSVAKSAARLNGVRTVLYVDAPHLEHHLAEPMTDLLIDLAKDYDALLAPATANAKNILPRVAALLNVAQISEAIKVLGPKTFERPIYAGNAIERIESLDAKIVVTIRTAAFTAVAENGQAPIEPRSAPKDKASSHFISEQISKSDRPELGAAKIIISGGRALGSADNFAKVIEPVAQKLGAAIGASRAAVDAGYAANDLQVGQTGKVVAPELYIACGISGAIQHLAGMKDSKVIVAINKDEEAPIFTIADYGLVGDLFVLLPELEKALG